MGIIIIMVILAIMLYGIKIMDKIDIFINNNINEKDNDEDTILIYGDDENISKVEKLLLYQNMKYRIVNDLLLDKNEDNTNYIGIITVSKDDLKNMLMCTIALRYYGIANVISICNNVENRKIYDKYNIKATNIDDVSSEEFISLIRENLKNV